MKGYTVSFKEACRLLQQGKVVSIPTETVYGLAGDIRNNEAIKKIFQIKKRPLFDPLIVHFYDWDQLYSIAQCSSSIAEKLSDSFHPGPLTLVLPKKEVSNLVTAHLSTVAVRMPSHPLTLSLLRETQLLLAAPSANLFSKTSSTRAEHVRLSLPVPVLDGGPCSIGIESTILKVMEDQKILSILRPGVIGLRQVDSFLKFNHFTDWRVETLKASSPAHPGQFKLHYAPDVPLVIIHTQKETPLDEVQKKIKKIYPLLEPKEYSVSGDPYLLSRNLYHDLRMLSENKNYVFYIVKNHSIQYENDTWKAIWDRLEKASSKRITL